MGSPTILSRLPTRAAPLPWLSLLMSPVSVVLWLILILAGLAVWVSTMKGSKQTWPAAGVGQLTVAPPPIVLDAAFVPHQLFVAVTAPPGFVVNRLLPARAGAVLPAIRLKLITKKLPLALLSTITPPPWPAAVFPVMVTLESVVVSPEGNPADIPRL